LLQELQANDAAMEHACRELADLIGRLGVPALTADVAKLPLDRGPALDEAALRASVPGLVAEQKDLFARLKVLEESDRRVTKYFKQKERAKSELHIDEQGRVRDRKDRKVDTIDEGPTGAVDEAEYVVDAHTGKLYKFLQGMTKK